MRLVALARGLVLSLGLCAAGGVAHAAPDARQGAQQGPRRKAPEPGWRSKPYVRPVAGVSMWGGSGRSPTTVAAAGVEAGILYRQVHKPLPRWRVNPLVLGKMYTTSGGVAGYHVGTGVRAGPWWKNVGIVAGPELYRDQLMIDGVQLDPVTGLAFPFIGQARAGVLGLYAGVEPSWFLAGDRPAVDWSKEDAFGFGDEFAYLAGASMRVQKMVVGVNWTRRITAAGPGTDWSVQAGVRL